MSIFHSHTSKQILGALGGMLAAAILYFGWQSFDQASLSARLIETQTVSDKVETIRTNAKNLDDATLRRLERRAEQVSRQLPATTSSSSLASQPSTSIATLTEFTNPIVPVAPTQRERIQSRIDRQRMIRGEETPGTFHRATEIDAQPASGVVIGTTATAAHTDTLPSSGMGVLFLSMLSLGIAGYHLLSKREKSL